MYVLSVFSLSLVYSQSSYVAIVPDLLLHANLHSQLTVNMMEHLQLKKMTIPLQKKCNCTMQKHLKILPPFPNLLKHVSSASIESNASNHSAKGEYYKLICRYSHLEVFKSCSENFIKLTGKHLIQSLLFNEASGLCLQNENLPQVLSRAFCKIFQKRFSTNSFLPMNGRIQTKLL